MVHQEAVRKSEHVTGYSYADGRVAFLIKTESSNTRSRFLITEASVWFSLSPFGNYNAPSGTAC